MIIVNIDNILLFLHFINKPSDLLIKGYSLRKAQGK